MDLLVALGLALIPAVAILYPFLRRRGVTAPMEDESSPLAELERRWDGAIVGLRQSEVDLAVGTLSEEDYQWLRERYMTEAALVMKGMELEEQQEEEMLAMIEEEVQKTRRLALGQDGADPSKTHTPSRELDE